MQENYGGKTRRRIHHANQKTVCNRNDSTGFVCIRNSKHGEGRTALASSPPCGLRLQISPLPLLPSSLSAPPSQACCASIPNVDAPICSTEKRRTKRTITGLNHRVVFKRPQDRAPA